MYNDDEEPDPETHTEDEVQAWRDARDAYRRSRDELRAIDADLDRQLAAAAAKALLRAAAHADGAADLPPLFDAVAVQTARLDRAELVAVICYLTTKCASDIKLIDELTGSLERVAGTGSVERIAKASERDEP